jgi:peptidoglycan hydrolase FlgJ
MRAISTKQSIPTGGEVSQSPDGVRNRARIKELSQEFESVFLEMLTSNMRKSVPKSGLMSGGNGEDIFQGLLDSEYAKSLSSQKLTGLAAAVEKQLLGMMGGSTSGSDNVQQKVQGLKSYALEALRVESKQGKIDK